MLVPPDAPVALDGSLIKLLPDAPLRERMGRRGRQRVLDAPTWDLVADRVARALIYASSRSFAESVKHRASASNAGALSSVPYPGNKPGVLSHTYESPTLSY